MGLEKWSPNAPVPAVEPGFVVYDTQAWPGLPHVYHTMLVRHTKRLEPGAPAVVLVADMTTGGIRFGERPQTPFRLRAETYLGSLEGVGPAEHSRLLGHLDALMLLPSAAGGWTGVYSLNGHGEIRTDPRNPQRETFHGSCVSLIEWCFEKLGYDLVNEDDLPIYDAKRVQEAFCPGLELAEVKQKLVGWELEPEESWPLLLPAQQMRAFRLALADLPRTAAYADHPIS